jgi:hypothetical protein
LRHLLSLATTRSRDDYLEAARLSAAGSSHEHNVDNCWDDKDRAELDVILAEYQTLRQESMNTINNRVQVMVLGLTAIAALVGGSFTIDGLAQKRVLVFAVYSFSVPAICIFVFMVWLSEAMRSHRAGHYIASEIEARINLKLGRLVMTWEASLWTGILPRDEMLGPSMIALGIPGMLAVLAPAFGMFITGTEVNLSGPPLYELWVPAVMLVLTAWFALAQMPRLRNTNSVVSAIHKGS